MSVLCKNSETAQFARFLGRISSKQFYVVIGERGENNESKSSWGGWANSESVESMGPYFANCKAGELLLLNDGQVLSTTPIPDFTRGHGFKGGVCFQNFYVAVSKFSSEHDELVAAIILYQHLYQELTLHHVGLACNEDEFKKHQCSSGYLRNKPDLFRYYVPQNDSAFGRAYIEYFFDPCLPDQKECHFDFVVEDIDKFLGFLAEVTGVNPEYWSNTDKNAPQAGLFITDSKNETFGVMVRQKFWNVEND